MSKRFPPSLHEQGLKPQQGYFIGPCPNCGAQVVRSIRTGEVLHMHKRSDKCAQLELVNLMQVLMAHSPVKGTLYIDKLRKRLRFAEPKLERTIALLLKKKRIWLRQGMIGFTHAADRPEYRGTIR